MLCGYQGPGTEWLPDAAAGRTPRATGAEAAPARLTAGARARSGRQRRQRLHLEQHAVQRQPRHRDQGAGRLHRLSPDPVQRLAQNTQPRLVVIDDQHGQLDDIARLGAGRGQRDAQIGEGLPRLVGEIGRQLAVLGLPTLPGDEHQPAARRDHAQVGIAIGRRIVESSRVGQGHRRPTGRECCMLHESSWVR
ncbi:hypothetical protein J9884_18880 [Chromobacterium violaceum]|nr:hypothetical protein [Chromobacterium violaceum]